MTEQEQKDGIIKWLLTMEPLSKNEIHFRFTVSHPKNNPLINKDDLLEEEVD